MGGAGRNGSLVGPLLLRLLGMMVGLVVPAGAVLALETDQYWAWGRPLADSTEAVNAKFTLELELAIEGFPDNLPPKSCREIAKAYRSRMRFVLFHDIQVWAWNSRWIARIPDGGDEQREYRTTNLYSRHPLIDTGTWMPYTPTISVAGVRFGTDKLAHLVSSGWNYYTEYRKGLANGRSPFEAERRAIHRGVIEESLILGRLASGVQAVADLEAGYAGIHLYRDLCDVEDPIVALDNGKWVMTRAVDLADYVSPRWDESYQPSIYSNGRWRKIKPVLEGYCDRLDDPQVVELRRRYRERDQGSVVTEVIAERVAKGKLTDPVLFGIEAVCSHSDLSREPGPPAGNGEVESTVGDVVDVKRAIQDEESDRRRLVLGLAGAHFSYPQVVSGSVAVMLTSRVVGWDCRTPCDYRGPFVELEPGLGGGKLSVGWSRVTGNAIRNGSFLRAAFIGVAYKLTVLRTWGDAGWVPGNRTYVGFELGVPVARANVGLGLLYRVDEGDGRKWTITAGAGWGF